jgi:hypothetical protein
MFGGVGGGTFAIEVSASRRLRVEGDGAGPWSIALEVCAPEGAGWVGSGETIQLVGDRVLSAAPAVVEALLELLGQSARRAILIRGVAQGTLAHIDALRERGVA